MATHGNYRKHNDRSQSSSTYHKKDGTSVRSILKREALSEIDEVLSDHGCDETQGTVISGTLRPQELLPAFLESLNKVMPAAYEQIALLPFSYIPSHAQEDENDEWWESEECDNKLQSIMDALDEYAPEGTWFGAHPGSDSDFGFWTTERD